MQCEKKYNRLETVKFSLVSKLIYNSEFLKLCKALNDSNKKWKNNEKKFILQKGFLELYFIYFLFC